MMLVQEESAPLALTRPADAVKAVAKIEGRIISLIGVVLSGRLNKQAKSYKTEKKKNLKKRRLKERGFVYYKKKERLAVKRK
jgi:hypothetical protein